MKVSAPQSVAACGTKSLSEGKCRGRGVCNEGDHLGPATRKQSPLHRLKGASPPLQTAKLPSIRETSPICGYNKCKKSDLLRTGLARRARGAGAPMTTMDTACWPERTVTQWVWPSQKEGRSRTSTWGGATIGPTALSAYRIKGAGLDRPSRDTRYDAQSWREPPEVAGLGQPLHSLPRLQYSTCTPLCSTYTQDSAKHTEEPGRATRKTRSLLREVYNITIAKLGPGLILGASQ